MISKFLFFFCLIQNGVQLKKSAENDEENGMISNKKPRKAALAKDKLYGCFVKVGHFFMLLCKCLEGGPGGRLR